ncbi:hypothetical protein E4U55_007177 [Claviceps digitariae]|nr:hypothetical protein E4U55_007177 [Claviceps digitariae]
MRRKPVPQPLTLGGSVSNTSSTSSTTTRTTRTEARINPRSPQVSQHSQPSQYSLFSPPAQSSQHSQSLQPSPPPTQPPPAAPALTASRPAAAAGRQLQTSTAQAGAVPQTLLQPSPSPGVNDWPSVSPTAHPPSQLHHPHHLRHPLPLPLHPPHQQARDDVTPAFCPPPVPSPCYDQASAPVSPASRHAAPQGSRRPGTKSGFFHFTKSSSKGFSQLHAPTSPHSDPRQLALSGDSDGSSAPRSGGLSYEQNSLQQSDPSFPLSSRSELSLSSAGDYDTSSVPPASGKRSKSKSFGLLSRSKSNKDKGQGRRHGHGHGHVQAAFSPPLPPAPVRNDLPDTSPPLRTAPIAQDRAFRDMMNSRSRNRSEDRAAGRDSSRDKERGALPTTSRDHHHHHHINNNNYSSNSNNHNNSGSNFLSGLRHSSTKAADIISKGLFGKSSRGGIPNAPERETAIDDEHYVLKVINLPLVEQTRRTRISKRLESSRDKTEFWMPAFPWRAIDYLNYKGCDVEGLYRVPGSGPQIKKWQRKFDEQHDVNLFDEDSLYDINIIGSMLKAWLRELPDELFPKAAQDRIARECSGATEVPQLLIDELSNLSPFNYYLLFAITCHLSLLLAHSEKNKMDFRNLCICFQPCMKIDAFCFKFLVCDWRNCWKGCKNEARYIEEEYRLFDQPPPRGLTEPKCPSLHEETNARNQTSLDSAKPPHVDDDVELRQRQRSVSNASIASKASTISTNVTTNSERETPERVRDIRPLSPIKPLSPIGF